MKLVEVNFTFLNPWLALKTYLSLSNLLLRSSSSHTHKPNRAVVAIFETGGARPLSSKKKWWGLGPVLPYFHQKVVGPRPNQPIPFRRACNYISNSCNHLNSTWSLSYTPQKNYRLWQKPLGSTYAHKNP